MTTSTTSLKAAAHALVDTLPDEMTWDDLMYAIYIRTKVEAAIADADAGRLTPHAEVKRRFLGSTADRVRQAR